MPGSLRDLITKAVKLILKFDLFSFQNKIENFQSDTLLKTFCYFTNVRMRMNAFREEAITEHKVEEYINKFRDYTGSGF